MKKKTISEEMNVQKEWYAKAKDMTLEELPDFLQHLMADYQHDYGTICHAMTAGALATMWAMDHTDQGGITGFQAGAIMWEFIRNWAYTDNKTSLKIINYDDFLYPQYGHKFDKTMSAETWATIQKEAAAKIKEADLTHEQYLKDLAQYKLEIEKFAKRYPEYSENPEKYKHLGCGTAEEWDKENEKILSGFEFAPREPYDGPFGNPVYTHWKDIVAGVVPFGFLVDKE